MPLARRGILSYMKRGRHRGVRPETLAKVAAAQALIAEGMPVLQACKEVRISPATYRMVHGGRTGTRVAESAKAAATLNARNAAAASHAEAPDVGVLQDRERHTVSVHGVDTGVHAELLAVTCDAASDNEEVVLASRSGMLTISKESGGFSLVFERWGASPEDRLSCGLSDKDARSFADQAFSPG